MASAAEQEKTLSEDDVRREHLATVNRPAHWIYLSAVLVGGTLLMVLLIAWLGASWREKRKVGCQTQAGLSPSGAKIRRIRTVPLP